jgi:hypothetical protein
MFSLSIYKLVCTHIHIPTAVLFMISVNVYAGLALNQVHFIDTGTQSEHSKQKWPSWSSCSSDGVGAERCDPPSTR